jgi:hypothetical protein
MRQTELNRAVARATGETVERVSRMGFSLVPGPNAHPVSAPGNVRAKGRVAHRVAVSGHGRGSPRSV